MNNILYEESGSFKVGHIITDNTTSLQIKSLSGKRSKIKAANIMLRFATPEAESFIPQAEKIAESIETEFLWECCPENEFDFNLMACDYFGETPTPLESAATLFSLHNAPIYFHKKGKGKYKAAPPEILKAALAGLEKKRQLEALQAEYTAQLVDSKLPEVFTDKINMLLYKPEKNSIENKALETACAETQLSAIQLLHRCGAIKSEHDFHFNKFLFEHFPKGTEFPEIEVTTWEELPQSDVNAFSIDDATTTEIDDAFSVAKLDDGQWRIGVHIAAPALGLTRDSSGDRVAAQRLSTVYMPGNKITMLPDEVVEKFTLSADRVCPAVSMYIDIDPDSLAITKQQSLVERIHIAHNLRHDTLEPLFNKESIAAEKLDYQYAEELNLLWKLALKLESDRGQSSDAHNQRVDYSFHIENDHVTISQRRRGSPIDKVVSELMILVNSEWGKQLAEHDITGIYRSQQNGKVKMSTAAAPHQGLGVAQYMWSSSPLRRYVDMINQRQLVALLLQQTAPYPPKDTLLYASIRDFEVTYSAYNDFQRNMERYWCLRWLQQESKTTVQAAVIKENLIRLNEIPLVFRVPSLPAVTAGSQVNLEIGEMDLLSLNVQARYIGPVEDSECQLP